MAANIEYPSTPSGTPEEQLVTMYNYLYRMAEALNANLAEIGSPDLTDEERAIMNRLLPAEEQEKAGTPAFSGYEAETLKSLIIKTASFVQKKTDEYRMNLLGEYVASGKFGRYVRNTNLKLDITPEGIQQDYTFEAAVQGERDFEINTRQFIRTGLLRTESSIPIYGVQVGKDICEFEEDGTVTYHDENKVAELTADALTFYTTQNQTAVPLASMSGSKLSFYVGGVEFLYIDANGIHAAEDLLLDSGKKVVVVAGQNGEKWQFDDLGMSYIGSDSKRLIQFCKKDQWDSNSYSGILSEKGSNGYGHMILRNKGPYATTDISFEFNSGGYLEIKPQNSTANLGDRGNPFSYTFTQWLCGNSNLILIPNHGYNSGGSDPGVYFWGGTNLTTLRPWTGNFDIYCTSVNQSSSRDIKHNIRDIGETGDIIDRLRPRKYVLDLDSEERDRFGLVYEETEDVLPEICTGRENDKALDYIQLIPVLLKEIQSLRRRVAELEGRNNG